MSISMGLVTGDDIFLTDWNASILGPHGVSQLLINYNAQYLETFSQTPHDGKLYELRIFCSPDYPNKPPTVRFVTRINLSSVDQSTGVVQCDLPAISNWNRNMTIESILVNLKNSMASPANRRLSQPPEGSTF